MSKLSKNSAPCYLAPNSTFTLTTKFSRTSSVLLRHHESFVGVSFLKNTTPTSNTSKALKITSLTPFLVAECQTDIFHLHLNLNVNHSYSQIWLTASWPFHRTQHRLIVSFFTISLTREVDSHFILKPSTNINNQIPISYNSRQQMQNVISLKPLTMFPPSVDAISSNLPLHGKFYFPTQCLNHSFIGTMK